LEERGEVVEGGGYLRMVRTEAGLENLESAAKLGFSPYIVGLAPQQQPRQIAEAGTGIRFELLGLVLRHER